MSGMAQVLVSGDGSLDAILTEWVGRLVSEESGGTAGGAAPCALGAISKATSSQPTGLARQYCTARMNVT